MSNPISEFNDYRSRMNKQLLEGGSNTLKRIFSLDKQAFQEGALDVATKELLGLVASTVLRCDDCVQYHLEAAKKNGVTKEEMMEAVHVGAAIESGATLVHGVQMMNKYDKLSM